MFASLCLLGFLATTVIAQEYPVPDHINVEEILKNERLMKNYLDCILGNGKCTPEGEELKKDIPDALQNDCAKCNDKHKEGIRKFIRHLVKEKPDWWKLLVDKFDPEGKFQEKYQQYLKDEGLVR